MKSEMILQQMMKLQGRKVQKKKQDLYNQYWKQVKEEQLAANHGKEPQVFDLLKNICKNMEQGQADAEQKRKEEEEAAKE